MMVLSEDSVHVTKEEIAEVAERVSKMLMERSKTESKKRNGRKQATGKWQQAAGKRQ